MLSSPIVGLIVEVIGYVLKAYGAKQATLAAYTKLVEASKNDGLIAVDTKDVFLAQKAELEKAAPPKA